MQLCSITSVLILGEDETDFLELKHFLDPYGYQLFSSSKKTRDIERSLLHYHPDVVLIQIDPKNPNVSLSLGRLFHEQGDVPFIYLSSSSHDATLFKAQKNHPYCYLIKPFNPINLHTSIQCALHCFKKHKIANSITQQLRMEYDELKRKIFNIHSNCFTVNLCDCYQFKVQNFSLFYKNSEVKLTKKERSLITLLIAQVGSIVHFEQIISFVWGSEHQTHNDVRTLMWRLNKKLPIAMIKNATGLGYYIEA
ncbi:MAG: winged helix-turn-helix domain-containing protein [Sulfuricurvum sp.]|nr:winged helix-turn-helix domain-containing protein [Sulfuricurvum sp.]MDD5385648.1 winged helix-turn-helix domain-containing protein [Sulfuricurvum sp.]